MRRTRGELYGRAVAVALAPLAFTLTAPASAHQGPPPPYSHIYSGRLADFGGKARMHLELDQVSPGHWEMFANVLRFVLRCDHGDVIELHRYVVGRVRRDGSFILQNHEYAETFSGYFEVSGRIDGRNRASGRFYVIDDVTRDDPENDDQEDCWTRHPEHWSATHFDRERHPGGGR